MANPWADQQCNLKFGSWTWDGNALELQKYKDEFAPEAIEDYSDNCPVEVRERNTDAI